MRSKECPTSAITYASQIWLEQYVRLTRLKESTGAGWDLMAAEARFVEAIDVIEAESGKVERERWAIEQP